MTDRCQETAPFLDGMTCDLPAGHDGPHSDPQGPIWNRSGWFWASPSYSTTTRPSG